MKTMATKTRRIILAPWQLAALAEGRLGCVVVPMKRQPDWKGETHPFIIGPKIDIRDGIAGMYAIGGSLMPEMGTVRCPFAPGDVLFVAEAWRSGAEWDTEKPNEIDPLICSDVWYEADEGPPTGIVAQAWGKLRPATTMPAWAARHRLKVLGVESRRVQSVTEDEAKACGCIAGNGSPEAGPGTEAEASWPATADFEQGWVDRYGGKFPFDTSWAWFVKVEVVA